MERELIVRYFGSSQGQALARTAMQAASLALPQVSQRLSQVYNRLPSTRQMSDTQLITELFSKHDQAATASKAAGQAAAGQAK